MFNDLSDDEFELLKTDDYGEFNNLANVSISDSEDEKESQEK